MRLASVESEAGMKKKPKYAVLGGQRVYHKIKHISVGFYYTLCGTYVMHNERKMTRPRDRRLCELCARSDKDE